MPGRHARHHPFEQPKIGGCRRAADPTDDRIAARHRCRPAGARLQTFGVDRCRNDDDVRVEAACVCREILVTGNHPIAGTNDGRDLLRNLQRGNEPIGFAHTGEKDRIVKVEHHRRKPAGAEHPLDDRRSNRQHFPIQKDDVELRDVDERREMPRCQQREASGFGGIAARPVDRPEKVAREQRRQRDVEAGRLERRNVLGNSKPATRALLRDRGQRQHPDAPPGVHRRS